MGKNITIKTAFQDHEPVPANIEADVEWLHYNLEALQPNYPDGVVLIFQQQVIGWGASIPDAKADAKVRLEADDRIPDGAIITPIYGIIGPDLPFAPRNLKITRLADDDV